jgi:hypothetical protein
VTWFTVRGNEKNVENKNIKSKKGDLTKGSSNNMDFSGGPQLLTLTQTPEAGYRDFRNSVDEKGIVANLENKHIYEVTLKNKGGLVMPVIIEWTFKDGTKEIERIPAEIWRIIETQVTKTFVKDKEVANMVLDPYKETADISLDDNVFPRSNQPSQFDKFKKSGSN